jgi:hypothetical protein
MERRGMYVAASKRVFANQGRELLNFGAYLDFIVVLFALRKRM